MFVADIMTENVHTISPSATLEEIREIFKQVRYRHLLVEKEGQLVGIVSDRDILKNVSPFLDTPDETPRDRAQLELRADTFMSTKLISVDKQTIIECASILLLENNISCLPVVNENGNIEGILSWKDLLQYSVYGTEDNQKAAPHC